MEHETGRIEALVVLIDREFEVRASLDVVWDHLAQVEKWPSWATHIRRVEVEPRGSLTVESQGRIRLANGLKSTFRMVEFKPKRSWRWIGPFLWLTIIYDHQFHATAPDCTTLRWVVAADGIGASTVGRVFAAIYNRNLDHAIPRLVRELSTNVRTEDATA